MTDRVSWQRVLAEMPLVAIIRGAQPDEILDIAAALESAGFLCLEVPLNSPDPLTSVRRLRSHYDGRLLIGAGTVLTTTDVDAARNAGAEFIVSPNTNAAVIRATKASGLLSVPGFVTPTDAFIALEAGADALKLFPTEAAPPAYLHAMKAVLPADCPVLPVGGVTPEAMAGYVAAGAAGFGIATAIYTPGIDAATVGQRARIFAQTWRNLRR